MGRTPAAKLIDVKIIDHGGYLKDTIQLDKVYPFKRIRYANNIPIGIENNYYPLYIGEKLQEYDLNSIVFLT